MSRRHRRRNPRLSSRSGGSDLLIILLVLAAGGGLAYWLYYQAGENELQPQNVSASSITPGTSLEGLGCEGTAYVPGAFG